ncbi:putative ABC transporter substrate-binding protein YesO [compost metagenome]
MNESSKASGTFNDQLYGIVTGVNAQSMMYNPEIFEEAGVAVPEPTYTYDDLIETARELKSNINEDDFYPIGSGGLDFAYFLRQNGASLYSKEGNALGYDKAELLTKFFEMEKMLVDEGLMSSPDIINRITSDDDALIVKGRAAFHSVTSNNVIAYSNRAGKELKLLPYPSLAGGSEGNYVKPSMYFSISAYTKHEAAAAQFIDFFFNDLDANDILLGERGVPATEKVSEHLQKKLSDSEKEQYSYMEYVETHSSPIDPPAPLISSNINILLNTVRNQMLDGLITPAEAAQQFRDGANEIFADIVS